ncbi:chitinase-like protein 2 [Quercus lobata]|nr:chitinase-like protein 2 [Quercus lobata]
MLRAKMEYKYSVILTKALILLVLVNCDHSTAADLPHAQDRSGAPCVRCNIAPGAPCPKKKDYSRTSCVGCHTFKSPCCDGTVTDYFQSDQFENLFSNRDSLEAHAKGFWDYHSFITASAHYQPYGFGTTYMNSTFFGSKEVAAFLAHVGTRTSCRNKVATKELLEWGLCYNKQMNSNSNNYCDEHNKNIYPCAPGVAYYGRGALPIYWNYNYGEVSKDLKVDLLKHPEYIEQNATLSFQVAIWRWMTPIMEHLPSAHDVFTGYWKPTKNDSLAKQVSGFGATINVLYGDLVCGQGDNEFMNNIISHYLYYLDLMGVGREEAGPYEVLSCAEQVAFNPTTSSSP